MREKKGGIGREEEIEGWVERVKKDRNVYEVLRKVMEVGRIGVELGMRIKRIKCSFVVVCKILVFMLSKKGIIGFLKLGL